MDNPFNLSPSGNAIFNINTKATSGMLFTGIGEMHLNNLVTTTNLPQLSQTCLKKREDEIGSVLETFAKHLTKRTLIKEKELSEQKLDESTTGSTGIDV